MNINLKRFMHLFLGIVFFALITPFAYATNHFIAYTDIGKGTPLVLIHAFPTDKRLWAEQSRGLAHYFRVITLDLWGFGESSSVDGQAIRMSMYADEVKQLLDQLHIQKAIIGGESMGGYVTLAFLQKYPNNVIGLVLSDTQAIADNAEQQAKREKVAQEVLANGSAKLIDSFMPLALTADVNEQTRMQLLNILKTQSRTAIASALRGMALREDTSNVLANTSLPVLIITGAEDKLIPPQQSVDMHQLAKNSKLIQIPHAAHLSSLEQPAKWNQAVIKMFRK